MADEVSNEEVESLAEKLEAFAASLPGREQDILAQVLVAAAAGTDDTAGFAMYASPTAFSVAKAIGPPAPKLTVPLGIASQIFPTGGPSRARKE